MAFDFSTSAACLDSLCSYLRKSGAIGVKRKIDYYIAPDPALDRRNESDHRSFCQVRDPYDGIRCAQAIEALRKNNIVGLLLHEIFHLEFDLMDGDESEVDVDSKIIEMVPESGYHYDSRVLYRIGKKLRSAFFLQCVSDDFLLSIKRKRE